MRTAPSTGLRKLSWIVVLTPMLACLAGPSQPTAFSLIKEGHRYVGEESKDKVVQVRSEKSVGTLTPNIWFVVYYDPDATLKSVEVKFGAGKKLRVSRPLRLLEPITGDDKILDRSRFKVDSDQAIKIATAEPLLQSLNLKATQLWLQRSVDLRHRDPDGPVWRVRLWAAKLKHPNDDVNIGDVFISTQDGKVVRSDLHINRVD